MSDAVVKPGRLTALLTAVRWRARTLSVDAQLEQLREALGRRQERKWLDQARGGRDVCWVEGDEPEPLVTVRIATHNRSGPLVERALRSALRQTYERLEILVVGDCTDEATDRAMAGVTDPRVRYVNLAHPSLYPSEPRQRWMAAGAVPMDVGNLLARGAWIAPCDDDDEMTEDHVEVLLAEAKRRRLELVHSRMRHEVAPGEWEVLGAEPLQVGQVTTGCVLYSAGLRFMRYNPSCWKLSEPHDWNLLRRMRDAGARVGFLDRVTYAHHLPDHDDALQSAPGELPQD